METRQSESANFQIAPIKVQGKPQSPTIYELQTKFFGLLCQDQAAAQLGSVHKFGQIASPGAFRAEAAECSQTSESTTKSQPECGFAAYQELIYSETRDFGQLMLSGTPRDSQDAEPQQLQPLHSSRLRNSVLIDVYSDCSSRSSYDASYNSRGEALKTSSAGFYACASVIRTGRPECKHTGPMGVARRCQLCGVVFIPRE